MKILGWIIALPFILLVLYALLRFAFCRPNYFVVKTATPMVEKIADYIVEHGIPESLDKIPNLPYELEGCKVDTKYGKEINLKDVPVNSEKNADWSIYEHHCNFFYKNNDYKVRLWFIKHYKYKDRTHGKIGIQSFKTHVGISFKMKNEKLTHDTAGSGFDNRFGFCQQYKM